MMLYLRDDLKPYFRGAEAPFDQLMSLKGQCYREQKGRITQRVRIGDKHYFIKQHRGVGWKEIVKNILQGRLPVTSAKNEWQALQKLGSLGIGVPEVVGYGLRGGNPARQESFVLMEEVTHDESLEDVCGKNKDNQCGNENKRSLIARVAHIARVMHRHGINHRDFYLCHFLCGDDQLYLIDLHRAQIRSEVPERWLIKDLAGLYFSSKDAGLTRRDLYRFIRAYRQKPLANILKDENAFWRKVQRRGEKLYRDHHR